MDKVVSSATATLADMSDGHTVAIGGFGLCGIPSVLIGALLERRVDQLEVVSNNAGVDLSADLEVELTPQGTLAERLRAGGNGIAAFFTATGVGTQVADAGLPWRYDSAGSVAVASPAKQTQQFNSVSYDLEHAIKADFALVRAAVGDRHGNLVFKDAARNFNPLAAMAWRICIAEVEQLVEPGEIEPNSVHLPGAYVHRVLPLTPSQAADKRIEKRTTR
jgi:3-oxoacid CoA-transferase subunit A